MNKDTIITSILSNQSFSSEHASFIHEFMDKLERDHRLNEVSVNFFRGFLGHYNIDTIKLLAYIYYYPKEVSIRDYPTALKLFALYLSSRIRYYNNYRLDLISTFVNEGSNFVDKIMRTLFMFDLHILIKEDIKFAFYMNIIDYNDLRIFLELNGIDYYTKKNDLKLDEDSFKYQLNFVNNRIQNQSTRIIR